MRIKQAGMTLVEVVVATGLLGLVTLAIAELMTAGNKGLSTARSRADLQNDLNVLSGGLQKFMTSNDFRFFAFSGDNPGTVNPKPLSRFLIPQAGRCRDLSTGGGCDQQSSFIYVNYDKTTTRAMTATCLLPPLGVGAPWTILVNDADTTYGNVTFSKVARTVTIADPGGTLGPLTVAIDSGALLAMFDPPKATLFVATDKPVSSRLKVDPLSGDITLSDGTPVPSACYSLLPPPPPVGKAKKAIDNLVEIDVRPFVLTQFTGLAQVTDAEVQATAVNLPLRLSMVGARIVGPMPVANPPGKFDFGYSECTITSGSNAVTCAGASAVTVKPIDRLRLDETFAVSLLDAGGAAVAASRFELLAAGMATSLACAAPGCAALPVPPVGSIPALNNPNERLDNLSATGFSFIKQESLSDLQFRVITNLLLEKTVVEKTESFNVHFP